jgi:alpha-glucosidase (family GH31 glycosyl hydrolase)
VPILDAGIAYEPNNKNSAFKRGLKHDIYIKDPNDLQKPFIGKVWPGDAVFVDWLHENAEDWWVEELKEFQKKIAFDGVWIDMNEAANFCNGHCKEADQVKDSLQNNLFWIPGGRDLNTKSISIDALHHDGTYEFEAHSLYGFYMTKASSQYFTQVEKRPFIISRSTYAGVGKFGSHWLGDNFSTWKMMELSVNGIYLFNMFGVPFVGSDICGFLGNTNVDLCARWYALGAFYPFARNHNDQDSIAQEPFVEMFQEAHVPGYDKTITEVMREMSLRRYALHRYTYTQMHRASSEGTVYFKPLFYNYPEDDDAFNSPQKNILLGDSVKVSPMLEQGGVDEFYFPEKGAVWCPLWTHKNIACVSGQSYQRNFVVPVDEVLVHIKSGSIIPTQLGDFSKAPKNLNLEKLKNIPTDLIVSCDSKYTAFGTAIFDDGETTNLTMSTEYFFSAVGASPFLGTGYLYIDIGTTRDMSGERTTKNHELGSVTVMNANLFKFKENADAMVITTDGGTIKLKTTYDKKRDTVTFTHEDGTNITMRSVDKISINAK